MDEIGTLEPALDKCLKNKIEKDKLPPRVLYFNTVSRIISQQVELDGCVTIYSDGCNECLKTIDYFRIRV